jgi:hypothetical protein
MVSMIRSILIISSYYDYELCSVLIALAQRV